MLLPLDSPAVRRWLEDWNPDLHPRGWHGRFGVDVAQVRAERRVPMLKGLKPDRRTPRSAGFTEEHWRTSFAAHGVRGETLEQYKKRAINSALARGMTQDRRGFFFGPGDAKQQRPLSPTGFPIAIARPRVEEHRVHRPGAERAEAQAKMAPRARKYRRARTAVLEKIGYRTVGTHTGRRRALRNKTAHEALFGYSPALTRFFEAETSVAGVKGAAKLHEYWTAGKGLAKWADSPQPWTTLRDHLLKFMDPEEATKTASQWFIDVFHFAAGSDLNRVTHGKPPRGKVVGPG